MLRDVFYYGKKPNVHPREQYAENLEDARAKATTRDFWIINEFCDYRNFDWDFDFEFLPDEDVWAEDHNNVWPSQHQKDSGTWLCPKEHSDLIIYRCDVDPVIRKNEHNDNWVELDLIDHNKFDFSWHPDPTDPPFIYKWGCKFFPAEFKHVLEYRVPGATQEKFMRTIAELVPEYDRWTEYQRVDKNHFDMSWRPSPLDPPFIYVWGNKYVDGKIKPTLEYHVPGATDRKHMPELVPVLPEMDNWEILEDIDRSSFDFNWRPDPTSPPYIYAWGNQWNAPEDKISVQYVVPGATDYKYMDGRAIRKPCTTNWLIPEDIDTTGFDFSWEPSPAAPPYIYEFATQWQKTGGPQYIVEGATEKQYVDFQKVKRIPSNENWKIPDNIDPSGFDLSWHPDATSPPYVYVFATQWAFSGGPVYAVPGATELKYVEDQIAVAKKDMSNWVYPDNIDINSFDFSWHPYVEDQPYIYQFGTQWQKTGGPKYITPGADSSSPTKYIDTRIIKATRLYEPENKCWNVLYPVKDFDFSWHPDDTEEPYIYVFGNSQYNAEDMPTVEYRVPGATQVKYVHDFVATLAECRDNWVIHTDIDEEQFDFSWRPHPKDPPYIYRWGNKYISNKYEPTVEYTVPGATEIKYMADDVVVLPQHDRWTVPKGIDVSDFDFTWRPDPLEPPYIYEFATQWQKTGGPIYTYPGATTVKYIDDQKAKKIPNQLNWVIPDKVDVNNFDFSWHPDATEPAYIYQFGTQWSIIDGPKYVVPGAVEVKYIDSVIALALPDKTNWEYDPSEIDVDSFDFSWHPYVEDQPYIYQFGTQWQKTGGPRYVTPGATNSSPVKYVDPRILKAKRLPNKFNFHTVAGQQIANFDYSWHPDETEEPYIYVFGNTQYSAEEMPTIEYRVPGATQIKYVNDVAAKLAINMTNWEVPDNIDTKSFDFSWVPHPLAPAYIYQFGTLTNTTDGPRYVTPDNSGEVVYLERIEMEVTVVAEHYIDTTLEDLVKEHPTEVFWAKRKNIDYSDFDFDWRPESLKDLDYVQVFGSAESELTQTYFVNAINYLAGSTDFKFIETVALTDETLAQIFIKPDMFYVDRGNSEANERFEALKAQFGNKIQKTRYLNSWVDTINRCINRSTTDLIWVLNSELDYNDFDFNYYPNPWQMKMVHVFGTQWSHWGTTFLVNRESFPEDTKYVKIIEHLSCLNFVKNIRANATKCSHDIVVIDHGNKETTDVVDMLQSKAPDRNITIFKYETSYLETLKNIIKRQQEKKEHFIWVCSSVCDYSTFDFTYICDPFSKDNLHVFPSGKQKFGDTFFIDVNNAREVITELDQLENFTKVNYNAAVKANRLPEPVIIVSDDTHTNIMDKITDFPYATFITYDNIDVPSVDVEHMNLWSPETKNIYMTSTGSTRIVAPKEIKDHVTKELYEYPYIKRAPKLALSKPLDIVFLSNGETGAEENYEHLLNITKNLPNRVVRVDGVNGRAAAYHAAAEASNTPWMFTVFAKLKVSPKFDWNWQPDRMQVPKHYIFHAKNPVNGLTYGHQAMIAYNKKLTLNNEGKGLDFTLDDEHEVVPLISGTAMYNIDEFSTWRTAFREVIKLKADDSEVSKDRLNVWLNKAEGDFAQYSIKGALDADEYYDEVEGDFDKLKLSYEWAWLRDRFDQM